MRSKKNTGVILAALGFVLLLARHKLVKLGWIGFWPLFILGPGLLFLLEYFSGWLIHKDPTEKKELLVPGVFCTGTGIFLFLFSLEYLPWTYLSGLWPVFLLFLGFGFYVSFCVDRQDQGLLIPGGVLTFVGGSGLAVFIIKERLFVQFRYGPLVLGILLAIVFGGGLNWRRKRRKANQTKRG
ncbi:MAG TPA: hypothetical protein VIL66_01580 [Bacillota bacterium]